MARSWFGDRTGHGADTAEHESVLKGGSTLRDFDRVSEWISCTVLDIYRYLIRLGSDLLNNPQERSLDVYLGESACRSYILFLYKNNQSETQENDDFIRGISISMSSLVLVASI